MGHTAKLCHTTHTHICGPGQESSGYDLTAGGRVEAPAKGIASTCEWTTQEGVQQGH